MVVVESVIAKKVKSWKLKLTHLPITGLLNPLFFSKAAMTQNPENPLTFVMSNAARECSHVLDNRWSFNKKFNKKGATVHLMPPNFPTSEIEVHALSSHG